MFKVEKLAAVVAYLLQKHEGRMDCTKLIKLVYLFDRKAIGARGRPMTGDDYCARPKGPVGENLYALIKGKKPPAWGEGSELYKRSHSAARRITRDARTLWNDRFVTEGAELVARAPDLPTGWLSQANEDALDELDARFHDATAEELVEWTHANCPEWSNPAPAEKKPITLAQILKATGWSKDDAKWAIEEAISCDWEDVLLADSGYRCGKRANLPR